MATTTRKKGHRDKDTQLKKTKERKSKVNENTPAKAISESNKAREIKKGER